jgi:omega-amidase
MRITLVQETVFWADKVANLQKFGNIIESHSGKTDLVVLPEMFTTGFCVDQLHLAESMNGETVNTIRQWVSKFNVAVVGSFIASEDGKIYNRAFFAAPNGRFEFADKRHLFTYGGEDKYFSSGADKLIVNYCGFNICVMVCYDLRFPVWTRNVVNAYDLLIFVANFPKGRIPDWDILVRARAIENQTYLCALNIVGTDGNGVNYNGHSVLLDAKANELIAFAEGENAVTTYDLAIEPLHNYRNRFAVWKDADDFQILEKN